MALELIGRCGKKEVFVTPYAAWRLGLRHLTNDEALRILEHRDVSYPRDEDGRQKITSTINGKKTFLVVVEDAQKIIIITGGEA